MTTAVTEDRTKYTILSLLRQVAALRARVVALTEEFEALEADRYVFAPAHIVEKKLEIALKYKEQLEKEIKQLEELKYRLRQLGYWW